MPSSACLRSLIFTCMCLLPISQSMAQEPTIDPEASDEVVQRILALFERTQPDMPIAHIGPSPIDGLYQVRTRGMSHIFVTEDAGFLLSGDLYEARSQGLVNRSESQRNEDRISRLASVSEDDMIIFEPEEETRATLTVFTDLDCPYCRQLHGDIDELNDMGIRVRYLAFPRQGMDSETAGKMQNTWCAENPEVALTTAKRGGQVDEADCDDPVAEQYRLGQELGVQGTPALVLEDGYMVNGYVPAEQLRMYLLESDSP